MGFNTVSVTASATQIVPANTQRQSLIVNNTGTPSVYVGPDDSVTSSNGVELKKGDVLNEDAGGTRMYKGAVYGITSSGTADVRYWERTGSI